MVLLACGALAFQVEAATKVKAVGEAKAVQAAGKGDAVAGRIKSESERCQECHGADGNGHGHEGLFAKLAGQYPEYIVKQIRNFRSGERKHDFMSMMAKSVDDADVADIATYFASLPAMRGDGGNDSAVGKKLFAEGDAGRNIAACASCHGAQGKGGVAGNVISPLIAGQDARYLEKQLLDWRSGERKNSTGGVMNAAAKSLTDAEIQALVHYLSGL
jgi:cytochrome c553